MECLVFFSLIKKIIHFLQQRIEWVKNHYCISKNEDGYVFFSSEIKILIRYFKNFLKINNDQVFHFMKFLHLSPNKTIFKNVQVVQPAEIIELKDGSLNKIKYWNPIFNINHNRSIDNFKIDLKKKLTHL